MPINEATIHLDFDGEALKLIEDAYRQSKEYQFAINQQCKEDYLMYRAFVDMTYRDNSMPNIALPKMFSVIEQKTAQETKALFGIRPYIPLESQKEELKQVVDTTETVLDEYLDMANFYTESVPLVKIKTMSGAAFMEFTPDYKMVDQAIPITNSLGLRDMITEPVQRFRLKCRVFAPWEVYIDPFAINLEQTDGCRYVVKMVLTSKRMIQLVQEQGAYPDIDIERLNANNGDAAKKQDHYGVQILSDFGLDLPVGDDDIGVLMRYESPDRYIDSWNGIEPLRDIPNPYKGSGNRKGHGGINLCRMLHIPDAHTQNRIWGIGEIKPNQVQNMMLDDLWNGVFRREQLVAEPLVFFREKAVDIDDLYFEMGNRIPVKEDFGRPISDSVIIHSGQELPKDQYLLIDKIERNIDMTSSQFAPQRGEGGDADSATEVVAIRESGAERQEGIIRGSEEVFLRSVARICLGHMNQFGTVADFAEIVGPEEAMGMTLYLNSGMSSSGLNFRFKGSSRVVGLQIKQRNLKELTPILMSLFNNLQFELARTLLESHEIPANEIEAIMNENIQRVQLQMGLAAQGGTLGGEIEGGQPGGRFQENNARQIAQGDARTIRGEV